ncbi:nuclear transport factor 2 family protein [Terricaulis sp.]|uniref:nuclear transport factor 2 family protein n=1 Tax=Terricaulis sp. TaxID=2768686 RepID=UPI003783C367
MPSRETVDAFVAQVVSGDHVGAIRDWYHDDAWMQENQAEPRSGRETLMAGEAKTLARMQSVETELLAPPVIDGNRVVIRWRFTFKPKEGQGFTMEELAWQTWRDDKIATETFFYDPKQMGR